MTPQTQHRPQSRAEVEAEERRNLGDARPKPGKKLTAPTAKQADRQVERLRATASKPVWRLWAMASGFPAPLGPLVRDFVDAVDRLNCFIAGTAVPARDQKSRDPEAPDFSGLTCGALEAKRATLCIAAGRACAEIMSRQYPKACETLQAAMDVCYSSGMGPESA